MVECAHMRQAVSLLLLTALFAPSFPFPLIAQEVGSTTLPVAEEPAAVPPAEPPLLEEVASSTPLIEEVSVAGTASTTGSEPALGPEEPEALMRTLATEAPPALGDNEQFLINQYDASAPITFGGAMASAYVYLQPAPVYTAVASGEVSSVRVYLARNAMPNSGHSMRIELYDSTDSQLVCWLVYGIDSPSNQYGANYAAIPVGDASDVVLVEFTTLWKFPSATDCILEEGRSYAIRLVNQAVVDPRYEEGFLYTRGANTSNEFFLQVIGEIPPPPPEPTPPPVVPGTILAKSSDAAWNSHNWTTGFAY